MARLRVCTELFCCTANSLVVRRSQQKNRCGSSRFAAIGSISFVGVSSRAVGLSLVFVNLSAFLITLSVDQCQISSRVQVRFSSRVHSSTSSSATQPHHYLLELSGSLSGVSFWFSPPPSVGAPDLSMPDPPTLLRPSLPTRNYSFSRPLHVGPRPAVQAEQEKAAPLRPVQ